MKDRYNASGRGRRGVDMHNKKNDDINECTISFNDIYLNHLNYLINIATNLHTFYNLPENPDTGRPIRSSFFERMLIYNGCACIAKTIDFGIIVSPCTIIGTLNLYGEPNKLRLSPCSSDWTESYSHELNIEVDKKDFVYFRNDNISSSLYPLIRDTAKELTMALFGMYKNIHQQQFPVVIKGTKDTSFTLEHIVEQIKGFIPFLIVKDNSGFDLSQSHAFNTDIPYVADKMYQSYTDILNNFFMRIGINIIPNAKKERMIVDEVNANNQSIRSISDVYLNNRIEGCEIARAMFPELKDLYVERNNDFIESLMNMSAEEHMSNALGGDFNE